jgi:hypothetical protein
MTESLVNFDFSPHPYLAKPELGTSCQRQIEPLNDSKDYRAGFRKSTDAPSGSQVKSDIVHVTQVSYQGYREALRYLG